MKTPRALGAAWLPLSPLEVSLPQLWEGMVPFVFPLGRDLDPAFAGSLSVEVCVWVWGQCWAWGSVPPSPLSV